MQDNPRPPKSDDIASAWVGGGIVGGIILLGVILMVVDPVSQTDFGRWVGANNGVDASAVIRNYGLVIAGVIAVSIAIWRARTADRNTQIAKEAHDREVGKMDFDRFQRGAVGLGSDTLTARVAAIITLEDLARDEIETFGTKISDLLMTFVKARSDEVIEESKPTSDTELDINPFTELSSYRKRSTIIKTQEDIVQAVKSLAATDLEMVGPSLIFQGTVLGGTALGYIDFSNARFVLSHMQVFLGIHMSYRNTTFENNNMFFFSLESSTLTEATFTSCDLTKAIFYDVDCTGATFKGCGLVEASFGDSNLTDTNIVDCDISDAKFIGCRFENSNFKNCRARANNRPFGIPMMLRNEIKLFDTNADDIFGSSISEQEAIGWAKAEQLYPQV